jgi:isopenicillin-N epimerase
MYDRRQFLGAIGRPAAAAFTMATLNTLGVQRALAALADYPGTPSEIATDEGFWFEVQQAFTVDRSLINLNNGGVCPSPAIVQEAMKRHLDLSNKAPTYFMWGILEPQKEAVRQRLARVFECFGRSANCSVRYRFKEG